MDTKFRLLYLLVGTAGLVYLIYVIITTFPYVDPGQVLVITIPDMLFLFLAYRAYPERSKVKRPIVKESSVVLQESRVRANNR